jgi:hypothetical protein
MIRFACHCGCELEVGESQAGTEVLCAGREEWVEVPHLAPGQPDRSHRRCPECNSTAVRCIATRRHLRRKLPQGDPLAGDPAEWNQAFVFRLPRECPQCGAIWIPPIPRWAGPLLILAGILLLLFFGGLPIYLYFFVPAQKPEEDVYISGGLVVGALAVIGYGYYLTVGGVRRPRILRSPRWRSYGIQGPRPTS